MSQDNNEAASALHSAIVNLPCNPPDDWRVQPSGYKIGHRDARHAAAELVAASAGQSSTPVPRVGGHDEAKAIDTPEFWKLTRKHAMAPEGAARDAAAKAVLDYIDSHLAHAHVARQRQESVRYQIREIGEGDWMDVSKETFDHDSKKAQYDYRTVPATPSAAVAEGVDTAELRRLLYTLSCTSGAENKAVEDRVVALFAQQREAGRREVRASGLTSEQQRKAIDSAAACVESFGRSDLAVTLRAIAAVPPAEVDIRALNERSDAWYAVCDVLREVRPDWQQTEGRNGMEAAVNTIRALARQPSGAVPSDEQIEQAALKHVATGWKQLAAVSDRDPDYRKTEQFVRLKAFALDLCATPAHGQEEDVLAIEALIAQYHEEVWNTAQSENPDYDYAGRETAKKLTRAIRALARQPVSEGLTEYGRNIIKNAAKALRCASFNASAEDLEAILSAVPPAKAEGLTSEQVKVALNEANNLIHALTYNTCPHDLMIGAVQKIRAILAQKAKGEKK